MPLSIYIYLFAQLLIVGYIDFKIKKIHNLWAIFNLVLFCILLFIFSDYYSFSIKTFFYPLTFLFVGYGLYLLKIMGAGDSKYLFAFYFLVPVQMHEEVFLCLAYTTVFVGSFLLLFSSIRHFKELWFAIKYVDIVKLKEIFGSRFSYAPVILTSWIWFGYNEFIDFSF